QDPRQLPEIGVAVGGDDDVAVAAGRRRARDVPGAGKERALLDALEDHDRQAKPRNLEPADAVSVVHLWRGIHGSSRAFDGRRGAAFVNELPRRVALRYVSIRQ